MLDILRIKNDCTGCGSCVDTCPAKALKMEYDDEGFYFPKLTENLCDECLLCESKCPVLVKECLPGEGRPGKYYKTKIFNCISSFEQILSVISDKVISNGGVFYGTRYDCKDKMSVFSSSDEYDMSVLCKSRFIEAFTGDIFTDVRKNMEEGRTIIFCGTPCHIRGLRTFLGKDPENIVFIEYICNGVISNKHFTSYKRYLEKKYLSAVVSVDFKPRKKGKSMIVEFANRRDTVVLKRKSLYNNERATYSFLRRSCYNCKNQSNTSDIVITDSGPSVTHKRKSNNENGSTVIIINSPKGRSLINSLASISFTDGTIPAKRAAYLFNCYKAPASYLATREKLFKNIKKYGYVKALKRMPYKISLKPTFPYTINFGTIYNLDSLRMKKDRFL